MPLNSEQPNRYGEAKAFITDIKAAANRIFSTEDGKKFAKLLFKSCRLFVSDDYRLSADTARYFKAQQDLINAYITNLVDKDVLFGILEYEEKGNGRNTNR